MSDYQRLENFAVYYQFDQYFNIKSILFTLNYYLCKENVSI